MNKPKMIMMCGLPASTKSTKAKELAEEYNATIYSSDEIRKELLGDENSQDNNNLVFSTLHSRIKSALSNGHNCIYDACNISYKRRMAFLQELNKIPCEKICILMATPYEECLKNNANRDRKVPEEVIERMYKNFHIPYWYEGWDDIKVIYSNKNYPNYYGNISSFLNKYDNYNQDNSHHKLSLGKHCYCAGLYIAKDYPYNVLLCDTALLHDCGKSFVKDFHNTKGEPTTEAHYYNHQYVSGYMSLFYGLDIRFITPLDLAIRIMWHMQPYFWEKDNNEKMKNKYRNMWGKILYDDIMLLHEADKNAH